MGFSSLIWKFQFLFLKHNFYQVTLYQVKIEKYFYYWVKFKAERNFLEFLKIFKKYEKNPMNRYIARECPHLAQTDKKLSMGKRKIQTNRLTQITQDQEKDRLSWSLVRILNRNVVTRFWSIFQSICSIKIEKDKPIKKSIMLLNSTGLEAPNLCNKRHCEDWLSWDGDFDSMQKVSFWSVLSSSRMINNFWTLFLDFCRF